MIFEKKISINDIYDVMVDFLECYWIKTEKDIADLRELLISLALLPDDTIANTTTASLWHNVSTKNHESNTYSAESAYQLVLLFLEEYNNFFKSSEIENLLSSMRNAFVSQESHPLWRDWLNSISATISKNPRLRSIIPSPDLYKNIASTIEMLSKEQYAGEKIEKFLHNILKHNPHHIDALLRLAVLEECYPFHDEERSIACLRKILSFDPHNITALLLFAHVQYTWYKSIDSEIIQTLTHYVTNNREEESLINYSLSLFYKTSKDPLAKDKQEATLLRSIKNYPNHVYNNMALAELYLTKHNNVLTKKYIQQALKNVIAIDTHTNTNDTSFANVQHYFDERIKGIKISSLMLSRIKEIESLSKGELNKFHQFNCIFCIQL